MKKYEKNSYVRNCGSKGTFSFKGLLVTNGSRLYTIEIDHSSIRDWCVVARFQVPTVISLITILSIWLSCNQRWLVLLDRKWNLKQSNWPISVHVDISRRDTITLNHTLVPMNTVSMIDNRRTIEELVRYCI